MTLSEATKLISMLQKAFPARQLKADTVTLYATMIQDIGFQAGQMAVSRLITTVKWMPTIAEIRTAAVEASAGPQRLGAEAWGDVQRAISRYGANRNPVFADEATAQAVKALGWKQLCTSTSAASDRARFVEVYDGLSRRQRADQVAGEALALPSAKGAERVTEGQQRALPKRSLSELPGFGGIGRGL